MRSIIWSNTAKKDYFENIDYLLLYWNEGVAKKFVADTDQIINLIKESPNIFPISNFHTIRKASINKHIQLYYRHHNQTIEILRFWNSHQNPKQLKFR